MHLPPLPTSSSSEYCHGINLQIQTKPTPSHANSKQIESFLSFLTLYSSQFTVDLSTYLSLPLVSIIPPFCSEKA